MSHYDWLENNFFVFLKELGLSKKQIDNNIGIIVAHGDKCYSYESIWDEHNIPFKYGVALYLLSYINPWSDTCRNTNNGFIKPYEWVIDNYRKYKEILNDL